MQVTVSYILFPRDDHEGGFIIFKAGADVCKGEIPWPVSVGDMLTLEGEFKPDRRQPHRPDPFVIESATPDLPVDSRARLTYAVSITKGLGAAKEEAIWQAYGDKWDQEPAKRLDGVGGLTEATRDNWMLTVERLADEAHKTTVIAWLISLGATMTLAGAAWGKWAANTQGVVNANPFRLAELPGWGFAAIDLGIRVALGIEDDDIRRLEAALIYILRAESKEKGSTLTSKAVAATQLATLVKWTDIDSVIEESDSVVQLREDLALLADYEIEKRLFERLFQ